MRIIATALATLTLSMALAGPVSHDAPPPRS